MYWYNLRNSWNGKRKLQKLTRIESKEMEVSFKMCFMDTGVGLNQMR